MCGITGLLSVDFHDKTELLRILNRMTQTLALRGPDAIESLVDYPVSFGHCRLSILDLSDAGSQPMQLGRRGLSIVYNGEIYNFRELRSQLRAQGCVFVGKSDTEVILHSYAQWGLSGLKRLEGIFALALWDKTHQRLILMRDRLGVKPLFYGESSCGFAFGSEIKAVLAAGGVDTALNDQAFSEYLWFGNSHGDRTIYRNIRALEPGQWMIIENGQRRLERWWRIEEWLNEPVYVNNRGEATEQIQAALDQAVERQLIADVPVGIFLSGGLDSSAIAASATKKKSREINSYAVAFDTDLSVNELPKASKVARHLGLNHHELLISGRELESILVKLVNAHDEPFGDAANIPLYLMCQQLQGKLKVVLQGDGGDEMFAGYRRYNMLRNAFWWRLWPKPLSPLVRSLGPFGMRFVRMAESVGHVKSALRMAFLLTIETQHFPPENFLLKERRDYLAKNSDPFLAYHQAAKRFDSYEPVQQMLLTDLTVQLPSQFLNKVDRASMSAGIESRVPLLDEGVGRLVVNLPSNWKVAGMHNKILLRQSQHGRLPEEIVSGTKTGFGVPYGEWLRTTLLGFLKSQILEPTFLRRFSLKQNLLENQIKLHCQRKTNSSFILWKFLNLAIWHNNYISSIPRK